MKRVIAIVLAAILVFSLAACGGTSGDGSSKSESTTAAQASTAESKTDDTSKDNNTSTDSKTLIVYFSPSNSDTADAVTAATPRVGDVSTVEYIARLINSKVNADMAKIVPKEAYSLDYNETADKAKTERDENARPEFTLDVNPEDYDTIFVGYPIWWYELPMIMDTFFDTYDLSGKTIIPFNTHAGSQDGGTYDQIRKLEPKADVKNGLAVSGSQAGDSESSVNEWLGGLGY